MREIKFRAWIKSHQEMIVVENIHFDGYDGFEISSGDYEALDHLEVELMQYTGLKDKNGKEIYEGDIVKVGEDIMVISWSEKFASFCLDKSGWAFQHWFCEVVNPQNVEVIGNIYENAELIKPQIRKANV